MPIDIESYYSGLFAALERIKASGKEITRADLDRGIKKHLKVQNVSRVVARLKERGLIEQEDKKIIRLVKNKDV